MKRFAAIVLAACACTSSREPSAPRRVEAPAPVLAEIRPASDGGQAADDAPCASDADCALTRVAPGGCCPMLCEPRVVTAARAAELDQDTETCTHRTPCPKPLCRPPRTNVVPVCDQRRCVARNAPLPVD
jgi:hypothetical protein